MKSSNRYCFAIVALFLMSTPIHAQDSGTIITGYDKAKNITTVKVVPVKISGDKDKYHSLHMSPAFSYSGHQPTLPDHIDFELLKTGCVFVGGFCGRGRQNISDHNHLGNHATGTGPALDGREAGVQDALQHVREDGSGKDRGGETGRCNV